MEVVSRWWLAFAGAVGAFLEEAAFHVAIAFDVLVGRIPRQEEKRWWNRTRETPVLVDVFDWTDDSTKRLLISFLSPFLLTTERYMWATLGVFRPSTPAGLKTTP